MFIHIIKKNDTITRRYFEKGEYDESIVIKALKILKKKNNNSNKFWRTCWNINNTINKKMLFFFRYSF